MKTKAILTFTIVLGLITVNNKIMAQNYNFPELPYAYNALEPYIDAQTMEIHYTKHHRAYFDNFVKAAGEAKIDNLTLEDIFSRISIYSPAIRNNGGGYYNHMLFWKVMGPNAGGQPEGDLLKAIDETFGSFDKFKADFENAAKTQFGSGWAWLAVDANGKLFVSQTPNQDNPLMDVSPVKGIPLLTIDVWEHAYYLKYQNKRADYVEAFWNVVNWDEVNRRYAEAVK